MYVFVVMIEGNPHRIFTREELAKTCAESLSDVRPDLDIWYVNIEVESKL